MDIKLYDTVRIKGKGIQGTVVDVSHRGGMAHYVVESSVKGAVDGTDGGEWPLFDCLGDELEAIGR